MKLNDRVQVNVNVTGEVSKQSYTGTFTALVSLSYRDTFREDEVRRGLIGADPANAHPMVTAMAETAAYLAVRVVEAPDWYKQSVYCTEGPVGRDRNVLTAVAQAVAEAINAEHERVSKAAEAAQADLKAATDKPA